MKIQTLLAAATLILPLAAVAENDSPWLPIPGQVSLSVDHTEQSGDSAYIAGTRLPLSAITGGGASKYRRAATQLRLGYGLSDAVSLDATLGYGKVRVGAADNSSGRLDSILGVNWRVLDEFERPGLPTLTLRGAAIIKGGYDGARLAALGNARTASRWPQPRGGGAGARRRSTPVRGAAHRGGNRHDHLALAPAVAP